MRRCLALGAALAFTTAAAAAQPPAPCRVPGLKNEVRCGAVTRPLDPARPDGPKIDVHYVVVPAAAQRRLPDPVFLLAGGPGQSAIAVAPSVLPLLARLANRRDLVFVDQRGTGKSAPLACDTPRHPPLAEQFDTAAMVARLRECRERLEKLAWGDLRFFTTPLAVHDLDAVRRALGADRVDVVGVSYGTRVALEWLRQFPASLRRVVLDGVAPPDMALPASFSADNQAAFDALAGAHPGLRDDWVRLLSRLPVEASAAHPVTGRRETFTLTRDAVLGLVRAPLYAPAYASALPQALAEAAAGRYDALVGLGSALGGQADGRIAMGMHFSVICAEDLPRLATRSEPPGADFGDAFASLYRGVCADWPRGDLPAAFTTIAPSPLPVLLVSGGADPATPPRHGERVARALGANAVHVVVVNAGHGVLATGCMREVLFRFVDAAEDRDALAVDAACAQRIPRPGAFRLPDPAR
jgi:pimeloyl-ACP methyl ester carboxylesterase